jgi:hypothetical protein
MENNSNNQAFNLENTLHKLEHYLPAQAPLKDFVHHNTLHAFQNNNFFKAINLSSTIFGTKTILSIDEFRKLFEEKKIDERYIDKIIIEKFGNEQLQKWKEKLFHKKIHFEAKARLGQLRKYWKKIYQVDIDLYTQPILFRILCNYLDQGIAIWKFPVSKKGFLDSIKAIEKNTSSSIFASDRAVKLLHSSNLSIEKLLKILVGKEEYYEQYLFDQQFTHPGWSGIVAVIEHQPQALLDNRKITLKELIIFELLLEIDYLDKHFGAIWAPLTVNLMVGPKNLFEEVVEQELDIMLQIFQEAYEWTYYDDVLNGIIQSAGQNKISKVEKTTSFQAMFCIDDRECSFRRYLEHEDPNCQTFGTPGFFGVEFYFQPQNGNFHTKVCPAPLTPKYLIKEFADKKDDSTDLHFHKQSHSLLFGWLISQTLGFWSAFKLAINIFKPSMSPATSYSFRHMNLESELSIENKNNEVDENGLQIGFTIEEMAIRVENLLRSIGLIKNFAPIVYTIGHGSTSVNNTHYAGYDCGACSGRPGSVNARVISNMANRKEVRDILQSKGIVIPDTTRFVGGLRDTSRDTIVFYDTKSFSEEYKKMHAINEQNFFKASDNNSKERSRRFESIDTKLSPKQIHEKVKIRSVSLFEPRPELNHATNTLCIVGRRELTKHLFLDRRAFMNSYDYSLDPDGTYLLGILNAAAPVCGGINLEYYFSRLDNFKLGAGTKLSHNVMGLIGVANGIDGDLRTGLPSQMIEVHEPIRLLIIVEHFPDVILNTISKNKATLEWFEYNWVNLVCIHPESKVVLRYQHGSFHQIQLLENIIPEIKNIKTTIESTQENIPVSFINNYSI